MQILQDEGERGSAYMQYEKNAGALAMRGVKKGCALHDKGQTKSELCMKGSALAMRGVKKGCALHDKGQTKSGEGTGAATFRTTKGSSGRGRTRPLPAVCPVQRSPLFHYGLIAKALPFILCSLSAPCSALPFFIMG